MNFKPHINVPDEVKEKAYREFLFDNNADIVDKSTIRQKRYVDKHGEFDITTELNENNISIVLNIDGGEYKTDIPLSIDSIVTDVYPWEDITFNNLELLSVSFMEQNEWADETYFVSYWGEPEESADVFIKDNVRILTQYYVPRGFKIDDPPLPEAVCEYRENNNYQPIDIRNFTQCKTPNPWAKYALFVLYENEDLANNVFNHNSVHLDESKYNLTPPELFTN